jgi:hypothetical protein
MGDIRARYSDLRDVESYVDSEVADEEKKSRARRIPAIALESSLRVGRYEQTSLPRRSDGVGMRVPGRSQEKIDSSTCSFCSRASVLAVDLGVDSRAGGRRPLCE